VGRRIAAAFMSVNFCHNKAGGLLLVPVTRLVHAGVDMVKHPPWLTNTAGDISMERRKYHRNTEGCC
jgi:hypothetical protein